MSQVDSSSAKKSTELTLIDKLSRLSYQQTLKLLGSDGPKLLRAGDSWDFRIEEDVYLNEDLFRLKFPLAPGETESPPVVTISLMDPFNGRLRWNCSVRVVVRACRGGFLAHSRRKDDAGPCGAPARARAGREPE